MQNKEDAVTITTGTETSFGAGAELWKDCLSTVFGTGTNWSLVQKTTISRLCTNAVPSPQEPGKGTWRCKAPRELPCTRANLLSVPADAALGAR